MQFLTSLNKQPTLTQLLCDGNPQLGSSPENMRGDPKLLLHCLEMQQKFKDVLTPKEAQRRQLQARSEQLYQELLEARSQIEQLEKDVASLKWERPDE